MAKTKHHRTTGANPQANFRRSALAMAISACFAAPAYANPIGASLVNGTASFAATDQTLTITNSPGAIINWDSFSINKGELTHFIQQNAASQVLNRVTGGDPSQILGTLQSNGQVFLINPSGIAFGAGAQVDVAGLVVSTLNLSNDNFLAGKLKFDAQDHAGGITNQGNINTPSGGQVIIVAPKIENSGIINAPNGDIILAAGKSVNLIDLDHPEISVEISAPANEAINLGQLVAKNISIYGGIVTNSGVINANTAVVGQNGKIVLDAQENLTTTPTSIITANGPSGGTVVLASQGTSQIAGILEAKAIPVTLPTQTPELASATLVAAGAINPTIDSTPIATVTQTGATSPQLGKGGTIVVLGDKIGLMDNASLDASGIQGGGTVLVGGDAHGQPTPLLLELADQLPTYINAESVATQLAGSSASSSATAPMTSYSLSAVTATATSTTGTGTNPASPTTPNGIPLLNSRIIWISSSARIRADAELEGDGGKIIVWADDTARVYGQLSTRGGFNSGNGGFVETSGKQFLDVSQAVDASAPNGKAGTWLMDPYDVTIQSSAGTLDTQTPSFSPGGNSSTILNTVINAALNAGTSVSIDTGSSGTQAGNLTVNAAISKTAGTDATLTLSAANNINISQSITSSSGKLNVTLNANSDNVGGGTSTLAYATINNNGGTTSFVNGLTLSSGRLQNGTITKSSGAAGLSVTGYSTLYGGVTLDADMEVNYSILEITNGLTLANGHKVTLNSDYSCSCNHIMSAGLSFISNGNQQLSGTGEVVFGTGNNAQVSSLAGGTLEIGSDITIHGATGYVGAYYGDGGLINHGIINADTAGKYITIRGNNWMNDGWLKASAGTLNLGGTFSTTALQWDSTGGTISLTGKLNNTEQSLLQGSNIGQLLLEGTITGGTVGIPLIAIDAPILIGVTLDADMVINDSYTTITDGLTLANNHKVTINSSYTWSGLAFDNTNPTGNLQLSGTGEVVFGTGDYNFIGSFTGGDTLEIGSGITVHGGSGYVYIPPYYGGVGYSLINNGTINVDTVGQTISIFPTNITNNGTLSATAGTLSLNPSSSTTTWTNDGTLNVLSGATLTTNNRSLVNNGIVQGTGILDLGTVDVDPTAAVVWGANTLTNNGTLKAVALDGSVGTLTLKGNLVNSSSSTVSIPLAGTAAANIGKIALVDGSFSTGQHSSATLGGTLAITENNGFYADLGNSFGSSFITATGGISGSFASFVQPTDVVFTPILTGTPGISNTTTSITRWATDASGDWATASNWTRGVPTANKDTVVSRSSANPTVTVSTGSQTAHTLQFDEYIALTGGTLTLPTGFNTMNSDLTLNGGTLINNNALTLAGNVYAMSGAISGSGSTTLTGSLTKSSSGTVTFNQLFVDQGTLNLIDGTLTLAQGSTLSNSISLAANFNVQGGTIINNGVDFTGGGTVTTTGPLQLNGNIGIASGTTFNLPTNTFVSGANSNLTNAGILTGNGVVLAGNLINTGSASLINSTIDQILTNSGSGTLGIYGTVNIGQGELRGGTLTLNNGATLITDGSLYSAGTKNLNWVNGTIDGAGTLGFVNGGNFSFSGNGDRVMNSPNLNFSFTDLILPSGSLTLNAGQLTFNTTANGLTNLGASSTLTLQGGTLTNNGPLSIAGTFNLLGGTYAGNGSLLLAGGTFNRPANSTASWSSTGTLTNTGTLNLGNASYSSPIVNQGTITSSGATFNQLVTNTGNWDFTGGTTHFAAGFTQTAGLTRLVGGAMQGNYNLNGGTLGGTGTITGNLGVGAGTLSPGFSPGAITINGNLNLSSTSVLNIELGGLVQGTGYDYVNVLGTANLAGTLNVLSYAGYTPAVGTNYNFMNFASATGSFVAINLPWANMNYNVFGNYLELLIPGLTFVTPSSIFSGSSIVFVGSTQTLLQGGLQNPMLVANAPAMSSTVPSTSQTLAELGIETDQPIFYERKQPTAADDESCK